MTRPRAATVATAALTLLALGGCAAFDDDGGTAPGSSATTGASDDGAVGTVLASVYPLQYLAEQIGGERVEVSPLTPPNVDPHTLELSPRTVAEMGDATLVVHVSGFQAAVDDAVSVTGARALDAADHTELLTTGQTGHDHDDHDHAHEDEAELHAGEPLDPHFWLDPTRLAEVGSALAEELAATDPQGADTYRENAERVTAELAALDEELTTGLADCERRTVVVAHEAYGYLTAKHDLHQEGLSGLDPDSEPSPARLAQIADIVAEHDVDTIFVEALLSPAVSEALARDLGLRTAVLDPLESQQDESADYLDVMRANLTALQGALGCAA